MNLYEYIFKLKFLVMVNLMASFVLCAYRTKRNISELILKMIKVGEGEMKIREKFL